MTGALRTHAWLSCLALVSSLACSETGTPNKPGAPTAGSGGTTSTAGSPASGGGGGGASGSAALGAGSGDSSGASGVAGRAATAGSGAGGAAGSAGTPSSGGAGTGGASAGTSGGTPAGGGASGAAGADSGPIGVLIFSKTAGYPHISLPYGIAALSGLAEASNWTVTSSADASIFTDDGLAGFDVLVFLSTTGDILDTEQEAAFQRFFQRGKGFVGIHAASDTEFDWAYYGELVGAYFREHPPDLQAATIVVEDATHVTTQGLPASWMRTDEWYAFRENPRPNVHVLMTLDESSYEPGTSAMGDHPIAWWHEYQGARVFYTALGHTSESYTEPLFLTHLARAIDWAAGR
jgi:cytochrome c